MRCGRANLPSGLGSPLLEAVMCLAGLLPPPASFTPGGGVGAATAHQRHASHAGCEALFGLFGIHTCEQTWGLTVQVGRALAAQPALPLPLFC